MANQNGKKYGLTALFPIKAGEHAARLRTELRSWDAHPRGSPLSEVPVIHMARFVIIDRLAYQGVPAERDDLRSAYLLFLCDFDGEEVAGLVRELLAAIPTHVAAIWTHCRAFPGIESVDRLSAYFERCQLETNLFLADQPEASVDQILRSLYCRRKFAQLLLWHQRQSAPNVPKLREAMRRLRDRVGRSSPLPGTM
jgi:hypothetical protein